MQDTAECGRPLNYSPFIVGETSQKLHRFLEANLKTLESIEKLKAKRLILKDSIKAASTTCLLFPEFPMTVMAPHTFRNSQLDTPRDAKVPALILTCNMLVFSYQLARSEKCSDAQWPQFTPACCLGFAVLFHPELCRWMEKDEHSLASTEEETLLLTTEWKTMAILVMKEMSGAETSAT